MNPEPMLKDQELTKLSHANSGKIEQRQQYEG